MTQEYPDIISLFFWLAPIIVESDILVVCTTPLPLFSPAVYSINYVREWKLLDSINFSGCQFRPTRTKYTMVHFLHKNSGKDAPILAWFQTFTICSNI